jgi:hypothetical protein
MLNYNVNNALLHCVQSLYAEHAAPGGGVGDGANFLICKEREREREREHARAPYSAAVWAPTSTAVSVPNSMSMCCSAQY